MTMGSWGLYDYFFQNWDIENFWNINFHEKKRKFNLFKFSFGKKNPRNFLIFFEKGENFPEKRKCQWREREVDYCSI
jgi:hypothetical protein